MKHLFTLLLVTCTITLFAQYDYAPSAEHPYGRPNPDAPVQIKEYEPIIGQNICQSFTKKADQTWNEPVDVLWTFKYILNGNGVQDETLKADGAHSGSIRQYNADSSRWYVHWYSGSVTSPTLSVWEGNREKGKIVLYREQAAPNGTEGYYRLTFSDIVDDGFKWVGEWVDKSETVVFPTWRIECKGKL